MRRLCLILIGLFLLPACGGLNYLKTYPGSENFHPKGIVVLPSSVGKHELVQNLVDSTLAMKLESRGWYQHVQRISFMDNANFLHNVSDYIVRLKTTEALDKELAGKIGKHSNVQALLFAQLSDWDYSSIDGNKVAVVGLNLILADVDNGIVWNAKHKLIKEYYFLRPELEDICEELIDIMINEMPH